MTVHDPSSSSTHIPAASYASIFPKAATDDLDADIVVIGAGIAGSSTAYHASSYSFQARVLVLEQFDLDKDTSEVKDGMQNRGSSRGGPRRIGTIGGGDRTKLAWKVWQDLSNQSRDKDLMDIAGEVYVVQWLPWGGWWL